MSDEVMDIKNPLKGAVARVINERDLIINLGSSNGVKQRMRFRIMAETTTGITDPETGEELGEFEREKIRVEVSEVHERFSICSTYRTYTTGGGGLQSLMTGQLFQPKRTHVETLRARDSDFLPELPEDESLVKRGDRITQIVDDPQSIDSIEETLKAAASSGLLERGEVQEAVTRWRNADAALHEARRSTVYEEGAIDEALNEHNAATKSITELLNIAS